MRAPSPLLQAVLIVHKNDDGTPGDGFVIRHSGIAQDDWRRSGALSSSFRHVSCRGSHKLRPIENWTVQTSVLSALEERGIHQEAVRFHSQAQSISEMSDGVKAFIGIVTEVIAGNPKILLIDEPEAFLHPALCSSLGNEICSASRAKNKRVFVSTHSPNFLMGCIQSGAPIDIVRLTYRDKVATARILPNEQILRLMRNPLMRSTGVLNGLFFEHVVITESDSDRAFYQEINERLLRFEPESGIRNCLFLNAQNKQTVHLLSRPLRSLGIPTACIVDVDVLKEGGAVWSSLLGGGLVPEKTCQALGSLRAEVNSAIGGTGKDMKRDGGTAILKGDEKAAADDLFDQLEAYGLFVVRGGELESWMQSFECHGHGPNWLISIFQKLGEDPESPEYVRPENGDVWAFVSKIGKWFADPIKKGMPRET